MHEQTTTLNLQDQELAGLHEALKRRGSLTIWFDPEMRWEAASTGRRGRRQGYSDAAIETCLSMKVLFGMALRQTTRFVESLLRLVGLDWTVPDFSTLSRRQKTLAVNIPCRGSKGPLNLLIDSTGIKGEGDGTPARMAGPSGGSGGRSMSEMTSKHWRSVPSRSPGATLVMRRSCLTSSARSRRARRPAASRQMALTTPANATMRSRTAALTQLSYPARTRRPGRPPPQGPSPGTKPYAPRNTSVGRSGDDGADITAEAASKQRCTA